MASSATQLQLLTGDGELEEGALVSFLAHNGAEGWNRRYRVVAVMGPQSSGKSTLMNHVFGTTFREMDHERGRSQTTRGGVAGARVQARFHGRDRREFEAATDAGDGPRGHGRARAR